MLRGGEWRVAREQGTGFLLLIFMCLLESIALSFILRSWTLDKIQTVSIAIENPESLLNLALLEVLTLKYECP
ncbi:MAG: hypothetical protein ACFBSE_23030 [Prochloraceae cyanobacterium]